MVQGAGLVDTGLLIDTVPTVDIVQLVDNVLALYFVHVHILLGSPCSIGNMLSEMQDDPSAAVEV